MMALALSHDGTRVAGGAVDGVRVWDVESGAEQLRLEVHEGDVWTLAFSPDGRFLSVAAGKNGILWDARTGRRLLRVPGSQTLHWTDFTADSKSVAFMSTDLQWFATEPPADLPPPEQALREVLARFGLRLDGTQLSQADQPAK